MQAQELRRWLDLGRTRAQAGDFVRAADCFAHAVGLDDSNADAWHNFGTALKKLGDHESALRSFKRALAIEPARAATYLNLGNLLIDNEQFEDAVVCFERAAALDPKLAIARSRLAEQVSQLGKVEQANALFRQSVGIDPRHVPGWFGLGRTLEDLGDADGALGCYRNVLQRQPDHALALGQYLALQRDEVPVPLLERASNALHDHTLKDEARALVGYGLARHHDRTGNYAAAAEAAIAANAARRKATGPLDREALRARVDGIMGAYDSEFFFKRRSFGLGTDQPVFIVGLPRSGTTLCEQILSSHPLVFGAGELPDLAKIAVAAIDGTEDAPWQAASRLTVMRSRGLGLRYLRALRNGAPRRRLRISDKSPFNYFQLGLAALLFPNARVIHCTRGARDNALSIWMENFSPDQRYATDFEDLAFFHGQYRRLMTHWKTALPLQLLELRYEDTVADVEVQARKLIKFLGVPWDKRCLDFHRNSRAVQTPSRWQVRQPIYTKSVERWRNYGQYLPGLLAAFHVPEGHS